MRFIPCKVAIVLFLLAVTGSARGFTLPRQLYDSKPAIGVRLNGSYQFGKELGEAGIGHNDEQTELRLGIGTRFRKAQ